MASPMLLYADCPDTSKSTIGYVFFYGGAILSWFSKLHSFVTTCTNHSEYAALAQGAKEAQWLVYLFEQLESQVKHTPVPMFVDNSDLTTQSKSNYASNSQAPASAAMVPNASLCTPQRRARLLNHRLKCGQVVPQVLFQ